MVSICNKNGFKIVSICNNNEHELSDQTIYHGLLNITHLYLYSEE